MGTLVGTTNLVVETCWCGIVHAVPESLTNEQRRLQRDGQKQMSIYCPLGHSWVRNGKGEADTLKEELERTKIQLQAARDQTEAAVRSRNALKGELTKVKNRVSAGLCLECNRHFANVERHIATKHAALIS
jgi:hypothetical protein